MDVCYKMQKFFSKSGLSCFFMFFRCSWFSDTQFSSQHQNGKSVNIHLSARARGRPSGWRMATWVDPKRSLQHVHNEFYIQCDIYIYVILLYLKILIYIYIHWYYISVFGCASQLASGILDLSPPTQSSTRPYAEKWSRSCFVLGPCSKSVDFRIYLKRSNMI
jgi:hypothetical protein